MGQRPTGAQRLFALLGWRGTALVVIVAALLTATLLAAFGLFLLLLPVFLLIAVIAGVVGRWRAGRSPARRHEPPPLIEGQYEILPPAQERDPTGGRGWRPR